MRRWVLIIGFALLILRPETASALLDFDSVSTITAPGTIMSFYFANVLGDSTDEIIVRNQYAAYVYDAFSSELLCTPPVANIPNNFQFRDMNSDGHSEFIYSISTSVYIYDVEDPTPIWTSPYLTQPFLYGIGDRNSDGHLDIVIVRWNPTSIDLAVDSALVDFYDGPDFQLGGQTYFEINRFNSGNTWASEIPLSIYFGELLGSSGLAPRLIVFTQREYGHYEENMGYFQDEYSMGGNIRLIDPVGFSIVTLYGAGLLARFELDTTGGGPTIKAVMGYVHEAEGYGFPRFFHNTKSIDVINADTPSLHHVIWSYNNNYEYTPRDWRFHMIDDINPDDPGLEILYGTGSDTLNLASCQDTELVWSLTGISNYNPSPKLYHNPTLFDTPQLIFVNPLVSRSGVTGEITSQFSRTNFVIDTFADINHDAEDELINKISNHLYIYHIFGTPESVIGNGHSSILPSSFALHANYPNPFNAQTIISYDLPKEADVKLVVYDLLGRRVATLTEGTQEAGTHQAIWDGSGVSSGLYFDRLKAGDYIDIKKMTLLK